MSEQPLLCSLGLMNGKQENVITGLIEMGMAAIVWCVRA